MEVLKICVVGFRQWGEGSDSEGRVQTVGGGFRQWGEGLDSGGRVQTVGGG